MGVLPLSSKHALTRRKAPDPKNAGTSLYPLCAEKGDGCEVQMDI